jgi:hypothetical protein
MSIPSMSIINTTKCSIFNPITLLTRKKNKQKMEDSVLVILYDFKKMFIIAI